MSGQAIGVLEQVAPGIARVLAPNPSAFTYTGTQTYLIGAQHIAAIDPGPDDPAHVEALLAALAGRTLAAILITHTHRDHSPAARPLAAASGAPVIGCAPLALADAGARADESFDFTYAPDRVLADGEEVESPDWRLQAVHTPGHTSNHLCFAWPERRALFSGDHVMSWSTSIVSPPDGDMAAYMASLDRLLAHDDAVYYPTHGPAIKAPHDHVRALIAHRRKREADILAALTPAPQAIEAMVPGLYSEIDPRLYPAAARSVLAHLIDLEARGLARSDGVRWSRAG